MSFIATAVGTKVAIAALSLVAIGGGTAVAAAATGGFNGAPVSDATDTPTATPSGDATETAAPTDGSTPSPSATQGPDATGPAAFGLCTAYTAGGLKSGSIAYGALLNASTSAGSIADYCAPILAAQGAGSHKPTSLPTQAAGHGKSGDQHSQGSDGSHGH